MPVRPNLGRQVGRLARLWRTELDNRLRPLGLSQARWILLVHLSDTPGGMPQLDLAVRAGVSGPTLVRQVDSLEDAGLVERRNDPNDRRIKRVCLTEAGRKRFQEVDAIAADLRHEVLEPLTEKEADALLDLTARLIRRMNEIADEPAEGAA